MTTDLTSYSKKLTLSAAFDPPRSLAFDDVVARAISRHDLADDVRGINASLDLIRETRGGRWPAGPVTEEENYVDLVWQECEFRDKKSFTFRLEARDRGYRQAVSTCFQVPSRCQRRNRAYIADR